MPIFRNKSTNAAFRILWETASCKNFELSLWTISPCITIFPFRMVYSCYFSVLLSVIKYVIHVFVVIFKYYLCKYITKSRHVILNDVYIKRTHICINSLRHKRRIYMTCVAWWVRAKFLFTKRKCNQKRKFMREKIISVAFEKKEQKGAKSISIATKWMLKMSILLLLIITHLLTATLLTFSLFS